MHNPLPEPESFTSTFFKVIHINKKKKKEIRKQHKLKSVIKILLNINYKTILFNLTYFKFREAIKFPVFVKNGTRLNKLKGSMTIKGDVFPGMILLGFGYVGHFDKSDTKLIWDVEGDVVFKGPALLKYGSKIVVGKNAYLEFGNKFRISPNSSIICFKKIVFGSTCRLSWDVQIMDTDFHKIKSLVGEYLNPPKEIIIGNHVWIGTRAMILKGAKISDNCIVASNSVVTKEVKGTHQIIAGIPAKVVKTGVTWEE